MLWMHKCHRNAIWNGTNAIWISSITVQMFSKVCCTKLSILKCENDNSYLTAGKLSYTLHSLTIDWRRKTSNQTLDVQMKGKHRNRCNSNISRVQGWQQCGAKYICTCVEKQWNLIWQIVSNSQEGPLFPYMQFPHLKHFTHEKWLRKIYFKTKVYLQGVIDLSSTEGLCVGWKCMRNRRIVHL